MTPSRKIDADMHQVLFAELHHRFYNSLQVISSLAGGMVRADVTPDACRRAAEDLQTRVAVLGELHRMLSEPHGMAIGRSCQSLCRILAAAFDRKDTRFRLKIASGPMDVNDAQGLLLMLAELVTNAMKHTLADRVLRIEVDLSTDCSGYDLSVTSNGPPRCESSIRAPRIASQLATRLGGTLKMEVGRSYIVRVQVPSIKCGPGGV